MNNIPNLNLDVVQIELYRYLAPVSSDAYKYTHDPQYQTGASNIYSYGTSRGGEFEEIAWYGLQGLLKSFLTGIRISKDQIDRMERIVNETFGHAVFNREGWDLVLSRHGGKIPLKIYALSGRNHRITKRSTLCYGTGR
jgi:nicotinamide phosphoribosyltransferase